MPTFPELQNGLYNFMMQALGLPAANYLGYASAGKTKFLQLVSLQQVSLEKFIG
jgi:hypothetical protein